MSNVIMSVFISATTTDLGECRRIVRDALLTHKIFPEVQEHFPPDYLSLTESLRSKISSCEAVICLAGRMFGAAPSQQADEMQRSYTQLEYDMAVQLEKPVFVFLTSDDFANRHGAAELAELVELQDRHRQALLAAHKCEFFSSGNELRQKVSDAIPTLHQLAGHRPMLYLPAPAPPKYFAGRDLEMTQLQNALLLRSPSLIALLGVGGQGKTTLVREVLLRSHAFPFAAGFWFTASHGGFSFDSFLDEALNYLLQDKYDKRKMPDVHARSIRLINIVQRRPTLIVIDGIEHWLRGWNVGTGDLEIAHTTEQRRGYHEGLDAFLTAMAGLSNGSHLVLTSRALPAALDDINCDIIPHQPADRRTGLKGLDNDDAIILLRKLGVKGSDKELIGEAKKYSNHPLALEVLAGLLVNEEGGRIENSPLIDILDVGGRLFALFDVMRKRLPGGRSAERVLQIASQFLEDPSLDVLWETISHLPTRRQGWRALAEYAGFKTPAKLTAKSLQLLVITLSNWNIVGWNGKTKVLKLHPLVKEFFANDTSDTSRIHLQLAKVYADRAMPSSPTSLGDVRPRYLAVEHALRAREWDRVAELMFGPMTDEYTYAQWLKTFGHLSYAAELLGRLAVATTGRRRAEFCLARSDMLQQLGFPEQAIDDIEQAVALFGEYQNDSPDVERNLARALVNRAIIHRETGKSTLALDDIQQAIQIFDDLIARVKNDFPDEQMGLRLDRAQAQMNRANTYMDLGRWTAAKTDYDQVCETYAQTAFMDASTITLMLAKSRTNRGVLFSQWERHEDAIDDLQAAIASYRDLVNCRREELMPQLAYASTMLAHELYEVGQTSKAIAHLDFAIESLAKMFDAKRDGIEPMLALACMNGARIRLKLLRLSPASADADRSVETYQKLVDQGANHLRGCLAHARLIRAEIRHQLQDDAGSSEDRRIGFEELRVLMHEWSSESNIRIVFQKSALASITYLLDHNPTEARDLALDLAAELRRSLTGENSTEALKFVAGKVMLSLQEMKQRLASSGIDSSEFQHWG